jgi:hypothetical protein
VIVDHDHVVNLYLCDGELVRDLVEVASAALRDGEAWLMIATEAHRESFEAAMAARSIDLAGVAAADRYLCVEAQETLDSFMVGGMPDRPSFERTVGALLRRVQPEGARRRRVHAFGEMVALLWQSGQVLAAIELESLWNEVIDRHDLALYCAYPLQAMTDADLLGQTNAVCNLHSRTIAPVSAIGRPRGNGEQWRMFFPLPDAMHEVRTFVRSVLSTSSEDELVEDACLVATELATNALRHVGAPFTVSVSEAGSNVRVSVRDTSPAHPTKLRPSMHSQSGRGLPIVEQLSTIWGTDDMPDGKVVWADLAA